MWCARYISRTSRKKHEPPVQILVVHANGLPDLSGLSFPGADEFRLLPADHRPELFFVEGRLRRAQSDRRVHPGTDDDLRGDRLVGPDLFCQPHRPDDRRRGAGRIHRHGPAEAHQFPAIPLFPGLRPGGVHVPVHDPAHHHRGLGGLPGQPAQREAGAVPVPIERNLKLLPARRDKLPDRAGGLLHPEQRGGAAFQAAAGGGLLRGDDPDNLLPGLGAEGAVLAAVQIYRLRPAAYLPGDGAAFKSTPGSASADNVDRDHIPDRPDRLALRHQAAGDTGGVN